MCRPMIESTNECRSCQNWTRLNLDDETSPEGRCGLPSDPGVWPFYWPNTLQSDGCGDGYEPRTLTT